MTTSCNCYVTLTTPPEDPRELCDLAVMRAEACGLILESVSPELRSLLDGITEPLMLAALQTSVSDTSFPAHHNTYPDTIAVVNVNTANGSQHIEHSTSPKDA